MINMDTRVTLDGMLTMKEIMENMHRIIRIMAVVITKDIIRILVDNSRHVETAHRKKSTITITMTTIGGTFGNGKTRVRKPFFLR